MILKYLTVRNLSDHLSAVIGYLSHEYKNENTGYIIVLTEQCPDPRDGGGSGKNLFGSLLKGTTTYISKPGSQTKFDEKFFQAWNGERIFAISDVDKNFDFIFLKDPSTGTGVMKKLYKNEVILPVEEMPKFLVQTNYSWDNVDGGLKRRIIPLEFTNFFTLAGGVSKYFGNCYFPNDWTADDWAGFDYIILHGVQQWLSQQQTLTAPVLSSGGWEKQIRQQFHDNTIDFIEEHLKDWLSRPDGFISVDDFNAQYKAFAAVNGIKYQSSAIQLNKALKAFCEGKNIIFNKEARHWQGPISVTGRSFIEKAPF